MAEGRSGEGNRLSRQTSPYLLQHARNPVDWYPWGEEALELARREDRPILLSVGYSACHWCHVMAHESFEDEATAGVMNRLFVNIKVDREERPDLDKIYQSAHQLLTGRGGGWPLTAFLTPDGVPFFAGTYFPPEARHGLPAFRDVLERVADFYRQNPERVREQNDALRDALARSAQSDGADTLGDGPLAGARRQLAEAFDREHGGFGGAPKFPHPTDVELLLYRAADGDDEARAMAEQTLAAMAEGGIYDQLGGGFFRYAVDAHWTIPHFEKMLYDNGPLLGLYADAWKLTGNPLFRRTAEEVGSWAIREMQGPKGGFYSTLDADTEGEEGKFYLWTPDEARAELSPKAFEVLALHYGLDRSPNFEGRWHLRLVRGLEETAAAAGLEVAEARSLLEAARTKLFDVRSHRTHPGRDEKVLTSWNALMIRGLATAGRQLQNATFLGAADQAMAFLRENLLRDGRLLASYKDGKASLDGYLDDYAFTLEALLSLLQARWRDGDLTLAIRLADALVSHFEDEAGGFFFTADDHEALIHRPRPLMDESLPSGNGVAARALLRLGHLIGEQRFVDSAERAVKAAWQAMSELPYAHATLVSTLEEILRPPQTVIIRGDAGALAPWKERAGTSYRPHRLTVAVPADAGDVPGLLAQRPAVDGVTAYVCEGGTCRPPATNLSQFDAVL